VGAHFGRAGQVLKMDPRRVTRLVERTAVGKGERGWVGESSPGSREAEGEGGEDFYMGQSGKRAESCSPPICASYRQDRRFWLSRISLIR
jgi:hypothetical protein